MTLALFYAVDLIHKYNAGEGILVREELGVVAGRMVLWEMSAGRI